MHVLNSQIEIYRMDHLGKYPTVQENSLLQLTKATNGAGDGDIGASGTNFPYGPYVREELPANAFDGKNAVTAVATPGVKPTAVAGSSGGWQYDATTGAVWPNNPEYYR
jgi:hypothetical protein